MDFKYIAAQSNGKSKSGVIEGTSRTDALDRLRRDGLTPITLKERSTTIWHRLNDPVVFEKDYTLAQITALTKSWASLLSAGMSVEQSLKIIIGSDPDASINRRLSSVLVAVQQGQSLSMALPASSKAFPTYYVKMIAAGERSGNLASTMEQLAAMLERVVRFRRELISALIYPAILMAAVFVSLMFMVVFVVPQFQDIFSGSQVEIPMLTKVVMAIGIFMRDYWFLFFGGLVALVGALYYLNKRQDFRIWAGGFVIGFRVRENPFVLSDVVRYLRTLGSLVRCRVPLEVAAELASATVKNAVIFRDLSSVSKDLKKGKKLSDGLRQYSYFPPTCLQLAIIGEQTGQLGDKIEQAASIVEDQLETSLKRASSLMVPLVTLFAGGIIGIFVVALLTGILAINDIAL